MNLVLSRFYFAQVPQFPCNIFLLVMYGFFFFERCWRAKIRNHKQPLKNLHTPKQCKFFQWIPFLYVISTNIYLNTLLDYSFSLYLLAFRIICTKNKWKMCSCSMQVIGFLIIFEASNLPLRTSNALSLSIHPVVKKSYLYHQALKCNVLTYIVCFLSSYLCCWFYY